jgi:dTDP-4-dehydrorhamnose 3,5-epimerase
MVVQETALHGVKVIIAKKHSDSRGFFSETHNQRTWDERGLTFRFVQDNHSYSREAGVVRGMHFQSAPYAQDKLVRVVRGRILDIVVDIRRSSLTFGRHLAIELSSDNWQQLLVPVGFAHGFCTLEPHTETLYKVTNYYSAQHDRGIAWDDPDLRLPWPISPDCAILSDKDRQWPRLRDAAEIFD